MNYHDQKIWYNRGHWFDLQWQRSRYILLRKPNKIETAVQCFRMSCIRVFRIFLPSFNFSLWSVGISKPTCRHLHFKMELELICLHTSSAIVSTQLNGFNNGYLTLIILLNINHLFVYSEVVTSINYYLFYSTLLIHWYSGNLFQVLLCITNDSIKQE